jgi:hypothetical protein
VDERRQESRDRRARTRGGRRASDQGKPWYLRRRLWLAMASLGFVAWKRVTRAAHRDKPEVAA